MYLAGVLPWRNIGQKVANIRFWGLKKVQTSLLIFYHFLAFFGLCHLQSIKSTFILVIRPKGFVYRAKIAFSYLFYNLKILQHFYFSLAIFLEYKNATNNKKRNKQGILYRAAYNEATLDNQNL